MIRYYCHVLNDPRRIKAYQRAIRKVVQPGDVVMDMGCGLGTYSLFAAQAGAKQVYAVDSEEIVHTARELACRNGYGEVIQFHQGNAEDYVPPQRVDCIITEFFGASAVDLLLTKTMTVAMTRFLKPGGRVIPSSIRIFAAPIEYPKLFRDEIQFLTRPLYGLDFSTTARLMSNATSHEDLTRSHRMAAPVLVKEARFPGEMPKGLDVDILFRCRAKGTIHGFALWFDADLGGGVRLTTSPASSPIAWQQLYLPLETPIPVLPGHRLHVNLLAQVSLTDDIWWRWEGYRSPLKGTKQGFAFRQHSFLSMPLPPKEALRLQYGVPLALSAAGLELECLLSQADGKHTLEDLAASLRALSPDRYRSGTEAVERVRALSRFFRVQEGRLDASP